MTNSKRTATADHCEPHIHPAYVYDMQRLLQDLWSSNQATSDTLRIRLTTEPNVVFAEYNLRGVHSKTIAVVHFEEPDIFHLPIPVKPSKPEEMTPDALLLLASHLIRCCMDGC